LFGTPAAKPPIRCGGAAQEGHSGRAILRSFAQSATDDDHLQRSAVDCDCGESCRRLRRSDGWADHWKHAARHLGHALSLPWTQMWDANFPMPYRRFPRVW